MIATITATTITTSSKAIAASIAAALAAAYPDVQFRVRVRIPDNVPAITVRYADGPAIADAYASVRQSGVVAVEVRVIRTTGNLISSASYADAVIGWR